MRDLAIFGAFGIAIGLARDPGCGGPDSDHRGVNAACTRDKDCRDGLVCREGVCADPDAGAPLDAQAKDAANDGT